jgi:hypothetical protein
LAFSTCASAGCHNFHDNRALYNDFLLQHAGEPDHLETQRVTLATFLRSREDDIKVPHALFATDADAPSAHRGDAKITADWARDAHARAGINCSGCHTTKAELGRWIAAPGLEVCRGCHTDEARTLVEGKHGMRLREGLMASHDGPLGIFRAAKLPPMTPAQARLPMKPDQAHTELGCNTCHSAHRYELKTAKVERCTTCHDDTHTKAYFRSAHYNLFQQEAAGLAPKGTGISCATCHMPAIEARRPDGRKATFVTHNQNDNLRPNEKMARSVCGNCHGLQFTLDALADRKLIDKNFTGLSSVHIESIEWAQRRARERSKRRQ